MRKLWLQVAHTGGATLVSVAGSAATMAVTARVLGAEGRGVYAAATAWASLFATLGSLSLGQVVLHHIAGRAPQDWFGETTGTVLALCAAVSAAAWAAGVALYIVSGGAAFHHLSPVLLAVALAPLPLAIWSDVGRYLLNALQGLGAASAAQVAGTVLSLAAVLVFVWRFDGGVLAAVAAVSVGSAAVGGVMLAAVLRRGRGYRLRVDPPTSRALLRGSVRLHLNAVGTYLFTQASVLVLNHYRTPAETGLYQLATQLFALTLVLSSSVGTVAFGVVAREGPDRAWPEQRRLAGQALLGVALIAGLAYLFAPLGVRLVAGDQFMPAVPLFRLLLPALLGATFSSVMASQWIGRGLFHQAALLTLAIGAVSLACDLALVPRYGMRGAAVSTLVTYGISVAGNGAMALWVESRWRSARRVQVG
jgi:O-antigen/teichoic acid export membrane protein